MSTLYQKTTTHIRVTINLEWLDNWKTFLLSVYYNIILCFIFKHASQANLILYRESFEELLFKIKKIAVDLWNQFTVKFQPRFGSCKLRDNKGLKGSWFG